MCIQLNYLNDVFQLWSHLLVKDDSTGKSQFYCEAGQCEGQTCQQPPSKLNLETSKLNLETSKLKPRVIKSKDEISKPLPDSFKHIATASNEGGADTWVAKTVDETAPRGRKLTMEEGVTKLKRYLVFFVHSVSKEA